MILTAGIQAWEEEEFILPTLKSLDDLCDFVLIGEGCWKTTEEIAGSRRSRDKTLDIINNYIKGKNKFALVEVNEENQILQRNKIWQLTCEVFGKPDWFLQGDADECFHEDQVGGIRTYLENTQHHTMQPNHYRFWGPFTALHYDNWVSGGSRFFKTVEGKPADFKCAVNCNWMSYKDEPRYFLPKDDVMSFTIFHPTYCKNLDRQRLKFKHREADDPWFNGKFPHDIRDGQVWFSENHGQEWWDSLNRLTPEDLPKYMQDLIL